MRVAVNKIIPFSSVDGPGNRTAVFLQGCNINCRYCHNPETRGMCRGCGVCVESCPKGALSLETSEEGAAVVYDETKCVSCDTCIHVCPFDSSPRTALMSPEEVYGRVKKQIPFIRGITVSGGECMLHPDFLCRLFALAKADGLGTLIDSNGTVDFSDFPELLSVTDGVMLDIKAFSGEDHRRITDHDNKTVLKNAAFLAERGKLFEVRFVIVPDLYDGEKSVRQAAAFLRPLLSFGHFRIKLIAYRSMGVREAFSHCRTPSYEELCALSDMLREQGFDDIIII